MMLFAELVFASIRFPSCHPPAPAWFSIGGPELFWVVVLDAGAVCVHCPGDDFRAHWECAIYWVFRAHFGFRNIGRNEWSVRDVCCGL